MSSITNFGTICQDDVQSSRSERQLDLSGAASGYGGYCPEGIPVETAIFGILGAFGVAFGVLYRAVTLKTARRRKRSETTFEEVSPMNKVGDFIWMGMSCHINFDIFLNLKY